MARTDRRRKAETRAAANEPRQTFWLRTSQPRSLCASFRSTTINSSHTGEDDQDGSGKGKSFDRNHITGTNLGRLF